MKDSGSRACPAIVCCVCLFSVSYDLLASLNELSSAYNGVRWMHKQFSVLVQRQNCIAAQLTAVCSSNKDCACVCVCMDVCVCVCESAKNFVGLCVLE